MRNKMQAVLWSLFALCIAPPPEVLSATFTHTYDGLNRLVQTVYQNGAKEATFTYSYDGAGNMLSFDVTANYLLGDVDGNLTVDLADAVLSLQVITGQQLPVSVKSAADIDGDGMIGMAEIVYVLRQVAEPN